MKAGFSRGSSVLKKIEHLAPEAIPALRAWDFHPVLVLQAAALAWGKVSPALAVPPWKISGGAAVPLLCLGSTSWSQRTIGFYFFYFFFWGGQRSGQSFSWCLMELVVMKSPARRDWVLTITCQLQQAKTLQINYIPDPFPVRHTPGCGDVGLGGRRWTQVRRSQSSFSLWWSGWWGTKVLRFGNCGGASRPTALGWGCRAGTPGRSPWCADRACPLPA